MNKKSYNRFKKYKNQGGGAEPSALPATVMYYLQINLK